MPFVDVGGLRGHHPAFPFYRLKTQVPTSWNVTAAEGLNELAGTNESSDWYEAVKELQTEGTNEYALADACIPYLQSLNTAVKSTFDRNWAKIYTALQNPTTNASSLSQCVVLLLLNLINPEGKEDWKQNVFLRNYAKLHASNKNKKETGNASKLDNEWTDRFQKWATLLEDAFKRVGVVQSDESRNYISQGRIDTAEKDRLLKTYNRFVFSRADNRSLSPQDTNGDSLFTDIGNYLFEKYTESRDVPLGSKNDGGGAKTPPDISNDDAESGTEYESSSENVGEKSSWRDYIPDYLNPFSTSTTSKSGNNNTGGGDNPRSKPTDTAPGNKVPSTDPSITDDINDFFTAPNPNITIQPNTQDLTGVKSQLDFLQQSVRQLYELLANLDRKSSNVGTLEYTKQLMDEIFSLNHQITDAQGQLSRKETDITNKHNTIVELTNSLNSAQTEKDSLFAKYEKLFQEVSNIKELDGKTKEELGKTEEKFRHILTENTELQNSNAKLKSELDTLPGLERENASTKAVIDVLREQLDTLRNDISSNLNTKLDAITEKVYPSYSEPPKVYNLVGRPRI